MKATVNVNGRISGGAEAVVPVFDHGFLYGEGVYETLRTYNGRPFLFDRHLARLQGSAGMLRLPCPFTGPELAARVDETLSAAGLGAAGGGGDAYIRILLTRGVGELSYDPATCPAPSLVIIVKAFVAPAQALFDEGVPVTLVSVLRNHPGALNPLIKSNNLLNSALAMQEALRRGAFEGIMRNYRGELTECTQSNFFVVRNGAVLTPTLESGLLAGVTRAFVLELAREAGLDAREAVLKDADLLEADEAFLTSTTRELLPIVRVDGQPIGSGRPGAITRQLLAAFRVRALALTAQASPGVAAGA